MLRRLFSYNRNLSYIYESRILSNIYLNKKELFHSSLKYLNNKQKKYDEDLFGSDSDFEIESYDNNKNIKKETKNDNKRPIDPLSLNLQRYERALELQQQGESHMMEDKFDLAISAYTSCIGTFNAFLEFKYGEQEDSSLLIKQKADLILDPTIGLAFAQHCIGRLEDSKETYEEALILIEQSSNKDFLKKARCILNYAELLCQIEKPLSAIEVILPIIKELRSQKSEIYASAVSNLAIYYAILKDYKTAITYAKEGFDVFSIVLGTNNPYTEGALRTYTRVLTDAGKIQEAQDIEEQWNQTRKDQELPPAENMHEEISNKLKESLKGFSNKDTFDPKGIIIPKEVLEKQQAIFKKNLEGIHISEDEFMDAIKPEFEHLKRVVTNSKKFEDDLKGFENNPTGLKEKLEQGIDSPLFSAKIDHYYEKQSDIPKE